MNASSLLLIGSILVLGILLLKLLSTPLRWAVKLLFHAAAGFVTLFLLNFFGSVIGISLTITWVSALVAGLLGLPGVLLLLALQYLL